MTVTALPRVMTWTVLPNTIMAKCWIDSAFEGKVLKDATAVLRGRDSLQRSLQNVPEEATFVVHRATTLNERILVLPYVDVDRIGLTREELLVVVRKETSDDRTLSFFLPADVIVDACFDAELRQELVQSPHDVLTRYGYPTAGLLIHVVENSSTTIHLQLPARPETVTDTSSYNDALHVATMMMTCSTSEPSAMPLPFRDHS